MKNNGKKIARIKDIAEKAKVSTGTVDRVIHNRGKVSEKARAKVVKTMEELNYEPNILARALVSSGEYRIAALIPNPANDEYWEAPEKGVSLAEKQTRQYGVIVDKYFFDPSDVETFKEVAASISEMDYNGILVAPIFYRESLAFLSRWKREGIPFNLFNTHIPDYEPVTYVGQDSYQSGVLAGRLLHYGGGGPGTYAVVHIDEEVANSTHLIKKEQGFIDYFENNQKKGVKIVGLEINNWTDENIYYPLLDDLISRCADFKGFFVTNSRSFVIGEYLKERNENGKHIVGYDLLSKNLSLLDEGLIDFLINQNPQGQGYWGIRLMVDHLVFKKRIEPIKYLPLDIVTKENVQYYI